MTLSARRRIEGELRESTFVPGHNEEVQGRQLRGKEDLDWNTDPIETEKLESLISQATQGQDSDVDFQQETVELPQLQSIDAAAVHRRGC